MKIEKVITLIIAIIAIGAIGFVGVKIILGFNASDITSARAESLQQAYRDEIATETNVQKLTTNGVKLIKGNQLGCGIINLERATTLDPNYRDAWVWLGYGQIKNNQSQDAVKSLKKAAEVDPIYPDTYKYLVTAYTQIGDSESAKKAQEKYDSLTKEQ